MNTPAQRLIYCVLVLAGGLATAGTSQSVGLTNLDEADPPAASAPASAPVAAAAPASAPMRAVQASAPKVPPPKTARAVNGRPASAWPDTSKLPAAGEERKFRPGAAVRPRIDPIAKSAPKPDATGALEPLAQHRQEMIQSGDPEKYMNSNTAVSRRYLRVDRATYARENKQP